MAWKGTYNSATSYSNGDEVLYTVDNVDRYYIYINSAAGSGNAPTNNAYWAEASLVIYNSDGTVLKLVIVDDDSYRVRQIMGDHQLVLYFSSATHVEIPVGSYVTYQGTKFTLERPEALTMQHSRLFEYTVTLEAYETMAKRWKFRNPVDGRLEFPLTAKPREHLQMFVDNMNRRDSGWAIGSCIEGTEKLISYDHAYCYEALQQMADEFETEFEIVGKTVSLHKVEYNKDAPLALSYGKGNGFLPGVGRSNSSDSMPVEILYPQGGEDNINASEYGTKYLLLPKNQTIGYDGEHFEDETGYDSTNARTYVSSADGYSIQRQDKALSSYSEDSLDCTEIYPKRVGKVGQVIVVDADNNYYDFTDLNSASDPCPNYEDYLIEGETMTVAFQSGMLAGREFEVKYVHAATTVKGVAKLARRFEIVPQEVDGETMPNATYKPAADDTYVVLHCAMPDAYICDNTSKSGASWEMFRTAVRHLYDNEDQKFSFTGTLDGIWAKQDWVNIGAKIKLGGYIQFTDSRFQSTAVKVRITEIKDYVNNPHSPEITLSNETSTGGFSSEVKGIEADTDVIPHDEYRRSIAFTKRRFRDAKETMKMLEDSLIDGYTQSITPVAAQMLQLIVGDDSLQFGFFRVNGTTYTAITPTFTYSNSTGVFSIELGTSGQTFKLRHYTLGINSLKSSHQASEYMEWTMSYRYDSAVLDTPSKKYYVYAKCNKTAGTGVFVLSETAIAIEGVSGYYHFLVGVLNSEYDGSRSFSRLYGFTEITGGRVTTERIVSDSGDSYLDLVNNALKLGDRLQYNTNSDGKLVLKGSLVQTGSGVTSAIGAFCGDYDSSRTYAEGDEVNYTADGIKSTYRYIYSTSSSGHLPTDTTYWTVVAQGQEGDPGCAPVFRGEYSDASTYYGNSRRLDIVRYQSAYYITKRTAGSISGILPTNTSYWEDFGASFESVATGFLFAQKTVIENAVVKYLQTQSSGKRIEVSGNVMNMFDENGDVRLSVEGRDIDADSPSTSYPITPFSHGANYRSIREEYSGSYSNSFEMDSFTVQAGANVSVPAMTAICDLDLEDFATCSGSVVFEILNSSGTVIHTLGTLSIQDGETLSIGSWSSAFSTAGTYRLVARVSYSYNTQTSQSSGMGSVYLTLSCAVTTSGQSIVVSSDEQLVRIGANGLVVNLGANCYASFALDSNNTPQIILCSMSGSSLIGLKVDSTGVKVKQASDTTWRNL